MRLVLFCDADRLTTSWSPIRFDTNGRNLSSESPDPTTRTFAALHSFCIPVSPNASTPWDQDWKNADTTMPREP